jgi:hypothetical protein
MCDELLPKTKKGHRLAESWLEGRTTGFETRVVATAIR